MQREHHQSDYGVRFDWGLTGAHAIGVDADVAVVVDVLSFTTTLSVAIDHEMVVLPYPWRDGDAAAYARVHNAEIAVGRSEAIDGLISLSPNTIRTSVPPPRLVLPSPNGSTIAFQLASTAGAVVGAGLRNAAAVAQWIDSNFPPTAVVAVIAAGERWPDGSLRPAVEDLWGAGAVLAELGTGRSPSPEARMAAGAWTSVGGDIAQMLNDCASGRELIDAGFAVDVDIAAEINSSVAVPVLRDGEFVG